MDFREWLSIDERFTALGKEFRDEDVPVALQHILDSHPSPENLIVTFTEVDKVGVNPKSVFSTTPTRGSGSSTTASPAPRSTRLRAS